MATPKTASSRLRKIIDDSQPEFAMFEHRTESASSADNGREIQFPEKKNGVISLIPMPTSNPRGMIRNELLKYLTNVFPRSA